MRKPLSIIILILTALCHSSCSRTPEPIPFGKDACEFCKMTIMDQKFGAEIVTAKGKILKFDSAECLLDALKQDASNSSSADTRLVIDYSNPGNLIDVKNAYFLLDKTVHSPMGGHLAAFNSSEAAGEYKKSNDGVIHSWEDVKKIR